MPALHKPAKKQRIAYEDWVWILLAVAMILFDEWATSGYYERTLLFSPIQIAGLNVAPIEFIVIICAIPFLPRLLQLLVTQCLSRHPFVCALVCVDFGIGVVTGYLRLGKIAGLAEMKALFLLGIFVYLSSKAMRRDLIHRVIPLLCWACIFQSAVHIYQYSKIQDIDLTIGSKSALNVVPGLLLPLFAARIVGRRSRSRWFYGVCIALVLFSIYLSQSRAWLVIALVGVILTVGFCMVQRSRPKVRMTRYIPAAGAMAVILLLVVGAVLLSGSDFVRSFLFWQPQANAQRNESNLGHYDDIQRGLLLIGENPITGLGFGGDLPSQGTAWFEVIHNEFLHFWILFGVGGAILWLYLFFILPVRFLRRLDRARLAGYAMRDEHYLIFSMIGVIITHALVLPSFHIFVQQIWMTGLYLACLTSVPVVRKTRDVRSISVKKLAVRQDIPAI